MSVNIDYVNKENTGSQNPIESGKGVDVIYLTGGGYVNYPFRGIANDSKLGWEEAVWSGSLTRSTDFVMTNILDVAFGLVARLELNFKYMNVQDYKVLCAIGKQRVCYATYYNRETCEWVQGQEMAFTGQELDRLYAFGTDYLGVLNASVKLVATNRDKAGLIKSNLTISYNVNGGTITKNGSSFGSLPSQTAKWSDNVEFWGGTFQSGGDTYSIGKSGFVLKEWNTKSDGTGLAYEPSQNVTVYKDMSLYAIWESR